jgi:quercetin dioxygenase-like cupin family protein
MTTPQAQHWLARAYRSSWAAGASWRTRFTGAKQKARVSLGGWEDDGGAVMAPAVSAEVLNREGTPPKNAATEQFDLSTVDAELRAGEPYQRDGHTARTLVRGPVLRVMFVVMRKGSKMGEHRAKEESTVHVVSGAVSLLLRDRKVELSAGQLLVLQVGEYHGLEATTDAALVLNIGWRAEEPLDGL